MSINPFEQFDKFLKRPSLQDAADTGRWLPWQQWRMETLEARMGKDYFKQCRKAHDARIAREAAKVEQPVVKSKKKKGPAEGPSLIGLE